MLPQALFLTAFLILIAEHRSRLHHEAWCKVDSTVVPASLDRRCDDSASPANRPDQKLRWNPKSAIACMPKS
jgi:hypothetical protein